LESVNTTSCTNLDASMAPIASAQACSVPPAAEELKMWSSDRMRRGQGIRQQPRPDAVPHSTGKQPPP
jgi:hypothetical protein